MSTPRKIESWPCTCTDEPNQDCVSHGVCAAFRHPCPCGAHGGALAYITTPQEMADHLDKAGVVGPTLHPQARSNRWNGWNRAIAGGVDADGRPITVETWHFASTHLDHAFSIDGRAALLHIRALERVKYPALMFAAVADIQHPRDTPTKEEPSTAPMK